MRDDPERLLDCLEAIERIEKVAGDLPGVQGSKPWHPRVGYHRFERHPHHHFGIDRDAVWNVIEHNLPALKKQVQE
ncbi:conserved hypothetical protein [Methanosphaerula palustris E1-9c]|uniref:Uncharacterized protein n=1 Tax=Methanosphaerula palustris (strain ATCC BAA-1556 / DSM 19958 / E1-9c) TaxID=521011 RepID=B8GK26_METPE|nr:conserved hypothetical protein [Methanosphaerula palustris E1-9c]